MSLALPRPSSSRVRAGGRPPAAARAPRRHAPVGAPTVLLLLLAPALPLPVAGQAPLALRGGMNLSRFVGGDSGDTDPHRGLNLGGAYRLFDVGRLGVWIEGYYRQKGADGLAALAGGAAPTLDVGLDYVEVPVLVRLDLTAPGSRVRPYLHGGPAFGWRIDCSVSLASGAGAGPTPDCDDLLGGDLESTLRDYEQGLVVGGGVDLGIAARARSTWTPASRGVSAAWPTTRAGT